MNDNNSTHTLIVKNVSHTYGDLQVLKNLSINVKQGEFIVLVGPSGCGKTTLLNLLSGSLNPTQGNVEHKGLIRTVYQQDGLFPWLTVSENIEMGLRGINDEKQKQAELDELFNLIHLGGFKDNYPHELSGGMKQRVEIARALAGHSDILLMDEPFSALDYQTRLRMRRELIRLLVKRPRTVVFVTHDIEEAVQLADRVLVLSNRPAYICKELVIDAQHPRDVTNPIVIEAMKTILDELGLHSHSNTDISNFE